MSIALCGTGPWWWPVRQPEQLKPHDTPSWTLLDELIGHLRGWYEDPSLSAVERELRRVQRELEPFDWKPMTSIGPGVREIRVHTGLEHRVLYVARLAEAVYVLHAFEKRSRQTAQRDVEFARQRFKELVAWRARYKAIGG